PRLPADAGQVVLAATSSMTLDATMRFGAAEGGRGAQVDIVAPRIAVTGASTPGGVDGYLTLDADRLSGLGAESLLLGGTRTQGSSGVTIAAAASDVLIASDAEHPLQAPELLLASNGNGGGIRIADGAVLKAEGKIADSAAVPISIGRVGNSSTGTTPVSGDGALIRIANSAAAAVTRNNVSDAGGNLTIGAGARLEGDSLLLDSTGDTQVDVAAIFAAKRIEANSSAISFVGDGAQATASGFVIGADTLAQLATAESVVLRSRSTVNFYGDVDITLDRALTLNGGAYVSDGGTVDIHAATLTLGNELGAALPAFAAGDGTLRFTGKELDFGSGNQTLVGFASFEANATAGIVGRGTGSFDAGSLPVTLNTPVIIADAGSDTTIRTRGALTVQATDAAQALALQPGGGAISLIGGSLDLDAPVRANAGAVTLRALSGDLTLGDQAAVIVAGQQKTFFDVTKYLPGGAISLQADQGRVLVAQGAVLDFSGAANGGAAGSLSVSATQQTAELGGVLKGGAADGYSGGAFSLDVGGAADLDALAGILASSGVDRSIAVRTRSGNLSLAVGNKLSAQSISLTADGGSGSDTGNGRIAILGTLDASGEKGGSIELYGKTGVDVEGSLLAIGSSATERGGTVRLYTSGITDGSYNGQYGYQNISRDGSGEITIGSGAVIDVSGGTAGGLSGGTVSIRAPLLNDGDVAVALENGAQIKGAREVALEAYATWSTTDTTTGSQHFDGIIDPAGWYDGNGQLLPGTFTDIYGSSSPTGDLKLNFFTPDAVNEAHRDFYQQNLQGFVQGPGFTFESRFADVANFKARPGIDLVNPDTTINN
ncbi:MAG: filamentous hemagglutinin family protein, partial [Solimonas sp.]